MSKQAEYDQVNILGVDVDAVSNVDAIAYILGLAAPELPAAYVVKPYVEFLDRAASQPELRELLNNANMAIPDGVALTWAAAYLYAGKRSAGRFWLTLFQIVLAPHQLRWPLPDRAAGINFTWPLLQAAQHNDFSIYLIGNPKHDTIEHTALTLQQAFPKLKLVGTHTGRDESQAPGQVSDQWLRDLQHSVSSAMPDIILVGMGFPLQERVCAYLASHSKHGVFIGEGGTFDYEVFGGRRPKAPRWIQFVGLEWFWRLLLEPQRVIRQLAVPRFIWRVWRSR
jgi:N-acetylglucosaminyldiphosphoundecaprenol N-acetyl-beta-D-mannosaminyltransferase